MLYDADCYDAQGVFLFRTGHYGYGQIAKAITSGDGDTVRKEVAARVAYAVIYRATHVRGAVLRGHPSGCFIPSTGSIWVS